MNIKRYKEIIRKKDILTRALSEARKLSLMIFHPNGNLNGSWVDDEDILLAYNPYKS